MNPAIGLAHYELGGGNRATLRWAIGFCVLAAAGASAYGRYGGGGTTAAMASTITPAMILVGVVLVIIVSSRVGTALKLDTSLDMGRSHRLMAISAPAAALGYLIGPSLPVLSVGALAALYAAGGFIAGDYDLAAWLSALLLLVCFASMLWTLTLLGGLGGKSAGIGWIWGVGAGAFFGTGGMIFAALPWLLTLVTPFSGNSVFVMRTADSLTIGHAIGAFMQLGLSGILFAAACRRWRRPDRPAMSPGLWLGLIALIVGGTLAGVYWFEALKPGVYDRFEVMPSVTVAGTLMLVILAAHGPAASNELQSAAWRLRRGFGDPAADEDKPRLPTWVWVAAVAVLVLPLGLLTPVPHPTDMDEFTFAMSSDEEDLMYGTEAEWTAAGELAARAWPVVIAATGAGLVTCWALTRLLIRMRMARFAFWVYLLLWGVPVALSAGWSVWVHGELTRVLGPVAAFGLPASLFHPWADGWGSPWPGVAWQWAVALGLTALALWVPDRAAQPATRNPVTPMPASSGTVAAG